MKLFRQMCREVEECEKNYGGGGNKIYKALGT